MKKFLMNFDDMPKKKTVDRTLKIIFAISAVNTVAVTIYLVFK